MKVSIDRVEGKVAVLVMRDDPSGPIHVPVSLLPPGCGEGDILILSLEPDREGTTGVKERVSGLIENLKKKE